MNISNTSNTEIITCDYQLFKPGVADPQAAERARQEPFISLGLALAVIGMVTNFHVVLILWKYFKNEIFIIYLKVLSMCDFWSCFGMLMKNLFEYYFCPQVYDRLAAVCKVTNCLGYVAAMWSMWLVVAISYDRYLHIYRPLHAQVSKRKTWIICGCSCICAMISALPVLLLYGNRTSSVDGVVTVIECGINDDLRNTNFPIIYYLLLVFLLIFLPIAMIFFYSRIRRTVAVGIQLHQKLEDAARRAQSNHQPQLNDIASNENSESTRKLTIIAIVITTLFFISYATILAIETQKAFDGDGIQISREKFMWYRFGFNVVFMNNIGNPFVYFFVHSRLRGGLLKLYTCKKK